MLPKIVFEPSQYTPLNDIPQKTSGIYVIFNHKTGKRYIGSSTNVKTRLYTHLNYLKKGMHHCVLLQKDWAKYGPFAFYFYLIEECPEPDLTVREQLWISEADSGNNAYNTLKVSGRGGSVLSRAKYALHMQAQMLAQNPVVYDMKKQKNWEQKWKYAKLGALAVMLGLLSGSWLLYPNVGGLVLAWTLVPLGSGLIGSLIKLKEPKKIAKLERDKKVGKMLSPLLRDLKLIK